MSATDSTQMNLSAGLQPRPRRMAACFAPR